MIRPDDLPPRQWLAPPKPLKEPTWMERCDRALSTPTMNRLLVAFVILIGLVLVWFAALVL